MSSDDQFIRSHANIENENYIFPIEKFSIRFIKLERIEIGVIPD